MREDRQPDRWFVGRPQPGARVNLLCLPYAGGGVSAFAGWAQAFGPAVEVRVLRLPGRESRLAEEPRADALALADEIAGLLAPLLTRPLLLYGHSVGALLAFETARALAARGLGEPAALIVAALRAPNRPVATRAIHRLPREQFLAELLAMGGTPAALLDNPELVELVLPALRADFGLLDTYAYRERAPLACPITAVLGAEDPYTCAEDLALWRGQTRGDFRPVELAGAGHFLLDSHREQVWEIVAKTLRAIDPQHAHSTSTAS